MNFHETNPYPDELFWSLIPKTPYLFDCLFGLVMINLNLFGMCWGGNGGLDLGYLVKIGACDCLEDGFIDVWKTLDASVFLCFGLLQITKHERK